ncbi:uncharacterized protein LOC106057398 isoform X2 [Biomphalaria glabrata]|uniref:Uncharacterized protein LOC106057398 isoform X2 n=1 Tax=Biomphalaria glabrata TaxID=6526 RepID=A0A9W2YR25_BIOGL|nr:uncharacterized protein LOC106057398 isoform X2 [Biomphalaria glabrata]
MTMFDNKLWMKVHIGKSGLQPLLGVYKPRKCDCEQVTSNAMSTTGNSSRVCSFRLPLMDSPADIEFLRNKFGWCMPREEQVIRSQTLTVAPPGAYNNPALRSTSSTTVITNSSRRQKMQSVYFRHHFVSKSSAQLDREKLMHKITEELKEYEKSQTFLFDSRLAFDAESGNEVKQPSKNRRRASSVVRHAEIRNKEMDKISTRARNTYQAHLDLLQKKMSQQISSDDELTRKVHLQIHTKRNEERQDALSKIVKLENVRLQYKNSKAQVQLSGVKEREDSET